MATSSIGRLWWDLDPAVRRSLVEDMDSPLTDRQVQWLQDGGLPVTSAPEAESVVRWSMGPELVTYLGVLRARYALDPVDQNLLNWRDAEWPDESAPGYAPVPGSSELVLVFTRDGKRYSVGWLRIRASGTAVSSVTPIATGSFEDCLSALHNTKLVDDGQDSKRRVPTSDG